jgi:hypothetical protein
MLKSDEGKRFDTITLPRLDMDCRVKPGNDKI